MLAPTRQRRQHLPLSRAPLSKGGGAALAQQAQRGGSEALPELGRSQATRLNATKQTEAESADKPGSVVDSHSSRPGVAARLKQPTREQRGPRQCSPIWSCSGWGLPCHATLSSRAVRSYRTVSPLPRMSCDTVRRSILCCTIRRLAPPRRYLAPCPVEPGLSSKRLRTSRPSGRLRAQSNANASAPAEIQLTALLWPRRRSRGCSFRRLRRWSPRN
jgi:hypothetical protein